MKHRLLKGLLAGAAALALTATAALPANAGPMTPNRDRYAAVGDSIPAGDGVTMAQSYPALLAGKTNKVTIAATSGATTADVVAYQVQLINPKAQQVTVTVGVNDLNWVPVVMACAEDATSDACVDGLADAFDVAKQLPVRVATVVAAVKTRAPGAAVYVTGYPRVFQPDLTSRGIPCVELPYEPTTLFLVDEAISGVNALIAAGAMGAGASFIPVEETFAGHGLCDGGESWIQGLDGNVPLHPNASGHRAYADVLTASAFHAASEG